LHVYEQHNYNKHPVVPFGMEALVHDKPHKHHTYTKHCCKAFVLGTSTKHYRCWKFWSPITRTTCISGVAFFKHKYLTNLTVTPKDQVIAVAACLKLAFATNIPQHLHKSSIQALNILQSIFHEATNRYNDNPTTHQIIINNSLTGVVLNPLKLHLQG
jgi:hypothetical protein